MMDIKKFKAIFFDLDGTLVDSKLDFKAMKLEIGMPLNHSILEYVDTLNDEDEKKKALDIVHQHELQGAQESLIIDGVVDFLTEIKKRKIKTGILTRNSKQCAMIAIDKHGLEFEHIITRDDFPPKPDPSALFFLRDSYGLDSKDCCYIGDYIFDIQTAKNAGMSAGLFLNEKNSSFIDQSDFHFKCFRDLIRN